MKDREIIKKVHDLVGVTLADVFDKIEAINNGHSEIIPLVVGFAVELVGCVVSSSYWTLDNDMRDGWLEITHKIIRERIDILVNRHKEEIKGEEEDKNKEFFMENKCPYCGRSTTKWKMIGNGKTSKPVFGSISVCIECAELSQFNANLKLVKYDVGRLSLEDAREVHIVQSAIKSFTFRKELKKEKV